MFNRAFSLLEIKRVDEDARQITGIATTPTADRMNDVVEPMGAQFTLADAAYASFIDRLEWLRFDDLWRDRPKLAAWVERLKSRPSFKKAQSPNEFRLPRPAAAA